MQITSNKIIRYKSQKIQTNPAFNSGGFCAVTGVLEKNIMLGRAIMVLIGIDIPWILKSNNKEERNERIRRYSYAFSMAYLTPFLTLPLTNRIAMKNFVKLSKNFWSNNHKAIHLSNKYLVNAEKTKEGLELLAKKTIKSPIEQLYCKITGKNTPSTLNIKEILDMCDGDYEILRKKLINAKNGVLLFDLLFTGIGLGIAGFVNNYITKNQTGKTGYSAEFKMADKEIIEKRAKNYEKNKNKRFAGFLATALSIGIITPILIKKGLNQKIPNVFGDFIKKHASKLDYNNGIYMSRVAFLLAILINHTGALLATRNKTELKDQATRFSITDGAFFGGDLILSSIFGKLSDNFLKTKLMPQDNNEKKSFLARLFPQPREITELINETKTSRLKPLNKNIATLIYWGDFAILSAFIGLGVPTIVNKMIKKDVQKDVEKNASNTKITPNKSVKVSLKEFLQKNNNN